MGDNQGAIALAKDNKFHSRTKHIDLWYHFIREAVDNGKIVMKYIPTTDNVADIFTKALAKPKFKHFAELLGLSSLHPGSGVPRPGVVTETKKSPHPGSGVPSPGAVWGCWEGDGGASSNWDCVPLN
jgi:hypothetical protein